MEKNCDSDDLKVYFLELSCHKLGMKQKKSSQNQQREQRFLEQLRERPELFKRMESILALAQETEDGPVRKADAVEEQLIEQLRQLGNETLTNWAKSAEEKISRQWKGGSLRVQQREKKNLKWWSTYGQIEVSERIWRSQECSYIHPLPKAIGVRRQGCSMALQRVLSDFGLEHSFKKAAGFVKEHYGFEISESTVAQTTLKHAEQIAHSQAQRESVGALPAQGAEQLIGQVDGSFVRIVETNPKAKDRRKSRVVDYQEARLCAATKRGSDQVYYEATFEEVDEVGLLWAQAAKRAGWALDSSIHVVGDGATWIAAQAERIFGPQGRFLVDFYHLCEYLSVASTDCSSHPKRWMKTQKKRLKSGHAKKVIAALKEHLEAEHISDENAPVRQAHRYMSNRQDQFHYHEALEQELPIGSGLIESGHKHVVQARMKIPGAAWQIDHAQAMIQARAFRANGHWDSYWQSKKIAA